MDKEKKTSTTLDVRTSDALDAVRAKLSFLAHHKTGKFGAYAGPEAEFGEFLILRECTSELTRIIG